MQRILNNIFTFTVPASTDWQIDSGALLPMEGYIVDATYRLAAGGTGGDLEIKVIDGPFDPAEQTNATINAIGDEYVVYNETGITLAASATQGVNTNVYSSVGEAAAYQGERAPVATGGGNMNPRPGRSPLVCVRGDGVLAGTVIVSLRCRGIHR